MIIGFTSLAPRLQSSNPHAARRARRGEGIARRPYDARHHGRATAPHATDTQCAAWATWIQAQPRTPAQRPAPLPPAMRVMLADVISIVRKPAAAPAPPAKRRPRHDVNIRKGPDGWIVTAQPALGVFRTRKAAREALRAGTVQPSDVNTRQAA